MINTHNTRIEIYITRRGAKATRIEKNITRRGT